MDDKNKVILLQKLIENIDTNLSQVRKIIKEITGSDLSDLDVSRLILKKGEAGEKDNGEIIEGVFDGQNMIGPDGRQYSVPPNYASKSKLVEGDILKLTIANDGSFVYKQIQPIERERVIGTLVKDKEGGDYRVLADKKLYRVLLASVTYFNGEPGDKVVILVPKGSKSSWAAVENIIKESPGQDDPRELELSL